MRIVLFLFVLSFFSESQNRGFASSSMNIADCTVEFNIDQIISEELNFQCIETTENKSFKIIDFKIKFKGHPAITVLGSSLNNESIRIAQNLSVGSYVVIYDINYIVAPKDTPQKYKALKIKIVD